MPTAYILGFLLFFVNLHLAAQSEEIFRIERYGNKDGLSHRWATCVFQDTKGYLWVGAYDGLNRYDGCEFITHRPSAKGKLPTTADFIYQVAEATDGRLYLGSGVGLLRFDPQSADFELLLNSKQVSFILLNPGRGVPFLENSVGYWGEGKVAPVIFELLSSGELRKLVKVTPPRFGGKLYLVQCDRQAAWFWDLNGSYHRFELTSKAWRSFPVAGSSTVPVDAAGRFWLPGVDEGLRFFPLPEERLASKLKSFNLEPGKAAWLYVQTGHDTFKMLQLDLMNGSLRTVFAGIKDRILTEFETAMIVRPGHCIDNEGIVWFTRAQGLFKVRQTGNLFRHFLAETVRQDEAPPFGKSTRGLAEDAAGDIYLSADQVFYKLDPETGSSHPIKLPPPGIVKFEEGIKKQLAQNKLEGVLSLIGSSDGSIWLSSAAGLFRYQPETGQFRHFAVPTSSSPFVFAEFQGKIGWGAERKVYFLDPKKGESEQVGELFCDEITQPVVLPKENLIWGFTDTGLVSIHLLTSETRNIRLYTEPREQRCMVSHRGWLWVGTSRGLEKIDPITFSHTNFDRSKGLPGNFVYSLLADGDYLWLGTSEGLCRFHVETGAVKNFFVEDGLSHNEFNTLSTLKSRNGRIFMGGVNGLNAFYPDDLAGNTSQKSRLLLSRFSLFDAKADTLVELPPSALDGGIELSPSVTSFNVHLALASYLEPRKNQYAWRMEGLEENWLYAGNQQIATYRHLPPGSYVFRAKAADSFGNWSENELTLHITILRPWYARWWAWLIYLTVVGGTILSIYRFQLSKKVEHLENLRLRELDEFRSRFFTNISHEFRTPLTVIMGNLEMKQSEIEKLAKAENLDRSKIFQFLNSLTASISITNRNAADLLRLVNQMLDLAKLESGKLGVNWEHGNVVAFLQYLLESFHSFADSKGIGLVFHPETSRIEMDFDREKLQHIVFNLLSNAIKHTPANGKIVFHVGQLQALADGAPTKLQLIVSDTGKGIPPEHLPNIFNRFYQVGAGAGNSLYYSGTGIGLTLTKELVELLGGKISVESEVDKGSKFTVQLPLLKRPSTPLAGAFGLQPPIPAMGDLLPLAAGGTHPDGSGQDLPLLLIVEDNQDVAAYVNSCFEGQYHVIWAKNGQLGIEKALEVVPDLIISDVMMPVKDGFELLDFLKNDERTSHVPIILLTARADFDSRLAGLERGADDYLAKPFERRELRLRAAKLIELRRKLQSRYSRMDLLVPSSAGSPKPMEGPAIITASVQPLDKDILVEDAFLKKLNAAIEKRLSDAEFEVPQLCRAVGISQPQLYRKIKALTNKSIAAYVRTYRLHRGKELLQTTTLNVSEVAYEVGFTDPKYFSRTFSDEFGSAPTEFRK